MPSRGSPFRWSPHGAADALETGAPGAAGGTEKAFDGAMTALTNLIPDPTTKDLWVCRPALTSAYAPGAPATGPITALLVVGTRAYYMQGNVGGANNALDVPYCYDLLAGSLVTITKGGGSAYPASPASTGSWTPPTMTLVGQYVVVCHPGFDGVTNYVGWIDLTTFTSPVWESGNTAANALPSIPVGCGQFGGRAYYLCNPSNANPVAVISDSLAPKTVTNGSYKLTFGDNVPLIGAIGLPLSNQLGGIIQSLMVFKANNVYQITGDPSSSSNPLTLNALNVAIGTSSPLSICSTPEGLAFVAPDGLRFIDFNARLSDPVGFAGDGITNAFKQSVTPSRVCAACNATVIRMSVQNGAASGSPWQEWWYHIERDCWSGPHTSPNAVIQPYGIQFVSAPQTAPVGLYISQSIPTSTSAYTELGSVLNWTYQTALLPPVGDGLGMMSIVRSQLWAGFDANSASYSVTALDASGTTFNTCTITGTVVGGGVWGTSIWGSFLWGGGGQPLRPRKLNWSAPLIYDRVAIAATGVSAGNVRLGDFAAFIEELGYSPNE